VVSASVDKREGWGHFGERLRDFSDDFLKATGEVLVGGTLNLKVDRKIAIREHFRMPDPWKAEPQVLQFEVCRVFGTWAYRVRPLKLDGSGEGGHGDDTIEIMCAKWITKNGVHLQHGDMVVIEFFGDESSGEDRR
jgi:CTP-dependent riboflavin kinase